MKIHKGDQIQMGPELLRGYDFEGVNQDCVKMDCACGQTKIFPFKKIKDRERCTCPNCGCVTTFSAVWIDKIEKELSA